MTITLEREADLSFAPVDNPAPRRLTSADIAHYNAFGYAQPFTAFAPDEAAAARRYVDGLLAAAGPDGAYAVNCYQARLAGLWDICANETIVDHVADLIGPNVICWASHVFSKEAGDPKAVPWHQDASYWRLSPARTVTVWLAIDDVDAENSAMRFVPGTHARGALRTRSAEGPSVLHLETEGAESMGAPFVNALRAGTFSLHADMLVHGSEPNRSDRRRCGLTIRYCPPDVAVTDAAWATGVEAILCRGEDPTGRWTHHPRPRNDDFSQTSSPRNLGGN